MQSRLNMWKANTAVEDMLHQGRNQTRKNGPASAIGYCKRFGHVE